MIRKQTKDYYWLLVQACLREFHRVTSRKAKRLADTFRLEVDSGKERLARELFYHEDPFDVANELAGKPLDFMEHRDAYLRVRAVTRAAFIDEMHAVRAPKR